MQYPRLAAIIVMLAFASVGAVVLLPHLFLDGGKQPKAGLSAAERDLAVGLPVRAQDGTVVGYVTGYSKSTAGRVERIRFRTAAPLGLGERIVIVKDGAFSVEIGVVQLRLSAREVFALPSIMMEDGAAATMGL
jgi:hypothetical protein